MHDDRIERPGHSALAPPDAVTLCLDRPVLSPCTLESCEYQVDPYIGCGHLCEYCYVLGGAETDWSQEILAHADLIGRLGTALEGIPPQRIYLGWHTDPYQPCERDRRDTRQVLKLLLERGFSASILTKSDLVLRDLDLLREMNEASVSVSVAFVDNAIRRLFEANTVDTEARIRALELLRAAGVRTAALLCPVIPWITDARALIGMLAPHTEKIWIYGLSVMDESDAYWRNIQRILTDHFPGEKSTIEAAVLDREQDYWLDLRDELRQIAREIDAELSIHV